MSKTRTHISELGVAKPCEVVALNFNAVEMTSSRGGVENVRRNLSAVEFAGDQLWLASDETWYLECLSHVERSSFGDHCRLDLQEVFDPPGDNSEMDLEGLSLDGNRLWVLGSHCRVRRSRARARDMAAANQASALDYLTIRKRGKTLNRCLFGYVDLLPPYSTEPMPGGHVPVDKTGNKILELMEGDPIVGPFTALPAKDNGLDFEGLAVRGNTAFLGLRGPVVGGLALILEIRIEGREGEVELKCVSEGEQYVLHALDLQGLGVRDLALHREELLILAAPTMPLDGPAAIFSWRFIDRPRAGGIADGASVRPILRLPGGQQGGNYAEGMALDKSGRLLVVFDNPTIDRLIGSSGIMADVFELEGS